MFTQHSAKATIDGDGIKRALELYAKDKGMPFDIIVTKFRYKKGSLIFTYDVKPKAEKLRETYKATCLNCHKEKDCIVDGDHHLCIDCARLLGAKL